MKTTKVTKATIKALLAKMDTEGLTVELCSDTVLFWYDSCDEDQTAKAEACARAVADRAGVSGWSGNGYHVRVNFKRGPIDLGDYNDSSSAWHY